MTKKKKWVCDVYKNTKVKEREKPIHTIQWNGQTILLFFLVSFLLSVALLLLLFIILFIEISIMRFFCPHPRSVMFFHSLFIFVVIPSLWWLWCKYLRKFKKEHIFKIYTWMHTWFLSHFEMHTYTLWFWVEFKGLIENQMFRNLVNKAQKSNSIKFRSIVICESCAILLNSVSFAIK